MFTLLTCVHITHLCEHHEAQKIGDDGQSQDEELPPVAPPEDLGVHVHHSSHEAFHTHKLDKADRTVSGPRETLFLVSPALDKCYRPNPWASLPLGLTFLSTLTLTEGPRIIIMRALPELLQTHVTDENTEAQQGEVTCPGLLSKEVAESGLQLGSLDSKASTPSPPCFLSCAYVLDPVLGSTT